MIDDPLLPAAAHLTGPTAIDVLRAAIAATGGDLVECSIAQVQYRPHSDLVVRYRCEVRTATATTHPVLLAGTTVHGAHPGTLPVEAETPDGTRLEVGVWRWPFDPVLGLLGELVTPRSAATHLGTLLGGVPRLEVLVYRPGERAVIRARGPADEVYVKVVPEAAAAGLVDRHDRLRAAGIPVPAVVARGPGWLAMTALTGTTLRSRFRDPAVALPPPERIVELLDALGAVHLDGVPPVRSRRADARHHAGLLATVLPSSASLLDEIVDLLGDPPTIDPSAPTVHGDLHDGQLIVDDHTVVGLLDIDDVGPGDPCDDAATLLAHLGYRAEIMGEEHIGRYARSVRSVFESHHARSTLNRHTAAVLVGLATGPFRHQQVGWETTTVEVLGLARRLLEDDPPT